MDLVADLALRGRPPIAVLGVPFDHLNTQEVIQAIEAMIASRRPHYLVTANVDFLVQARQDVELRRILCNADMVLCDGTPVMWASRLLGNPLPERVAGADLVPLLIRVAADRKFRLFFLGASPDSAATAMANLRQNYPGLVIAGHYSPPFNPLLEMDHQEIRQLIQQAKPDLLFVSFGCPKQEKWIAMNYRSLGIPVAVGVGATIDFLAGHVKRAPLWMQRSGTEWLFRLLQEPRRLLRRYLKDLWVFGWAILAQWWRLHAHDSASPSCYPNALPFQAGPSWQWVKAPDRLDLAAAQNDALRLQRLLSDGRDCLLELAHVEFLDSTGVGLLLRLQKQLQVLGRQLVLQAPGPTVMRVLKLLHLEDQFICVPDHDAALEFLGQRSGEPTANLCLSADKSMADLTWQGEITAANAEQVWRLTRTQIANLAVPRLIVDLSQVRFIDSSGLGVMVRVRKLARGQNISLIFAAPQPAVRNVVELAKLNSLLSDNAPAPAARSTPT